MTAPGHTLEPASPPARGRRFRARLMLMALLWLGLNGADGKAWIVGGPVVLAATWISVQLLPSGTWRWSVGGAIRFLGFFLRESWRGGWDVARRALSPKLPLAPALTDYAPRLPAGPALWFFCNAISLLPGTALVAIERGCLVVHVLDAAPGVQHALRRLEERVADLFGLGLPAPLEVAS